MQFYISNYGTERGINIFTTYKKAKEDSYDGEVHLTEVNDAFIYQEIGGQNPDPMDL